MRGFDFTTWQAFLTTLIGLALVTLIGVGVRLLVMVTIQQRRERANRQINERLKTLIAAYKTLGGSFTGDLSVNPAHLRELRRAGAAVTDDEPAVALLADAVPGSDRARRIRDAVEAALSDVILLGTQEHVRLAEQAARELVAGRPVHTHDLVVSLRNFVREALDLDPIPATMEMPRQGPTRPSPTGGGGKGARGQQEGRGGGGGGGMGGGGMGGGGMSGGMGGSGADIDTDTPSSHRP